MVRVIQAGERRQRGGKCDVNAPINHHQGHISPATTTKQITLPTQPQRNPAPTPILIAHLSKILPSSNPHSLPTHLPLRAHPTLLFPLNPLRRTPLLYPSLSRPLVHGTVDCGAHVLDSGAHLLHLRGGVVVHGLRVGVEGDLRRGAGSVSGLIRHDVFCVCVKGRWWFM